jgi:hypothetical protein
MFPLAKSPEIKFLRPYRQMCYCHYFPFSRGRQLCSYSITSQHFMEPECSLPYSQEPSTCTYPESDQSNPYHPNLSLAIHLNIMQQPMFWPPKWSLSFWLSHPYPTCNPLLPICATFSAPLILFNLTVLIILGVEYKF